MSGNESMPAVAQVETQADVAAAPAVQGDIIADDAFYRRTFGISKRDADQPITYGKHAATFGDMITDLDCPVGGAIRKAYKEGGDAAVDQTMDTLATVFTELKVTLKREPVIADTTEPVPEQNKPTPESKKKSRRDKK